MNNISISKISNSRTDYLKKNIKENSKTQQFITIDLFCGAGGITEGFKKSGFHCIYGNDINQWAIKTFKVNNPEALSDHRSIEIVNPHSIRLKLKLKKGDLDVLVGGPPCQGFSINAPERFLDDPRNSLFKHYIGFIKEFMPKTFLFENVPGMLSLSKGAIYNQILSELKNCGYKIDSKILFAAHYGVPQQRWRLIILGSRIGPAPEFPKPTHYVKGRTNFTGGKTLTMKLDHEDADKLKPAVTVHDALADLPKLKMGEGLELMEYGNPPHSEYAMLMRGDNNFVSNHISAKLSVKNQERLKHIKPGGSWRDIPHELLPKGMQSAKKSDHTKRYGRLKATGLASTIMTKCDPHWGPVFLPDQDRSLTVREAARLQSFPDEYKILGPRVSQYEQVGNAVPVLLAKSIADSLLDYIKKNS